METNNKEDIKTNFEETGRQNKKENNEEDDTNNNKIENLTEEENNVIKEYIIKDLETDINSLKNNIYDNDIKEEI